MTRTIHLDDHLAPCDGVDFRDVEGAPVLFNVETGKYFGLEGVGVEIWQALDEGLTIGDTAERLVQSYDVPLANCQKDVLEFAQRLCGAGLLQVVES